MTAPAGLVSAFWPLAVEPLPWALTVIRAGRAYGEIPVYGGVEWLALHPMNPRRAAAVATAAEAWRNHCSPKQIALDHDAAAREFIARLRAASNDVSAAANWTAIASEPTHAELVRRRSA